MSRPLWIGGRELSRAPALSLDWGGGGVVTVAADLVRFQRALHGGTLLSPRTVEHLTRPRHRLRRGIHYGAGAVTLRFGELVPLLLRGLPEPVGGLGALATHMFRYPALDAHVVLNFHSTREMRRSVVVHSRIARELAAAR